MKHTIASKIQNIETSKTMALSKQASELMAQNYDIVSLTAGIPDFKTPNVIAQSAIQAINEGFTYYTSVDGIAGLKNAIIKRYNRDYGLDFKQEQILITSGAKFAIFNALNCLIEPEEEVLIPAPYWVSYPSMVQLCQGKPVIVRTSFDNGLKIKADHLEKMITSNTKAFIFNNPNNPSGIVYSELELKEIAEVIKSHPQLIVLSDDIYDMIYWDSQLNHLLTVAPELQERVFIINGVSKSYAMTGWRIGYAIAPPYMINAMSKYQSQSLSSPCSISQKAAITALNLDWDFIRPYVHTYRERLSWVKEELATIPGLHILDTRATFYIFPQICSLKKYQECGNDVKFCEELLKQTGLCLVPGSSFGLEGHIRISCSYDMATIKKGIARLKAYLSE